MFRYIHAYIHACSNSATILCWLVPLELRLHLRTSAGSAYPVHTMPVRLFGNLVYCLATLFWPDHEYAFGWSMVYMVLDLRAV